MPPPTKDSVLELEVRRRIVDAVREHPGLHLRALAERLDLPVSTLEYHCYQLVRHEQMTSRQDGGYKAFYPAEGLDRRDKDILYLVRHDAPRKVCTFLLESPGATPKEIRMAIGMAAPTLSFHLKKLVTAGLIDEEPAGRTKHLSLADPERVASVLVTYRGSFVDAAVDRFADTWLGLDRPPAKAARAKGKEAGPAPRSAQVSPPAADEGAGSTGQADPPSADAEAEQATKGPASDADPAEAGASDEDKPAEPRSPEDAGTSGRDASDAGPATDPAAEGTPRRDAEHEQADEAAVGEAGSGRRAR